MVLTKGCRSQPRPVDLNAFHIHVKQSFQEQVTMNKNTKVSW